MSNNFNSGLPIELSEVFISGNNATEIIATCDMMLPLDGRFYQLEDNLNMIITIRNLRNTEIRKNTMIRIFGGQFYHPCVINTNQAIARNAEIMINFELVPIQPVKIELFPQYITFHAYEPNQKHPIKSRVIGFQLRFNSFLESLIPANILVFGLVGAGKTTLINGLYSLLNDSVNEFRLGATNGSSRHVTSEATILKFGSILDKLSGTDINFTDTPGLTLDSYSEAEFLDLLIGKANYSINKNSNRNNRNRVSNYNEQVKNLKQEIQNLKQQKDPNLINSVMFVTTIHSREDQAILLHLRKFIEIAVISMGITPILVITKLDISPNLYDKVLLQFSAATGLHTSQILMIDNNPGFESASTDFFIRKKTLALIFQAALKSASTFYTRRDNQLSLQSKQYKLAAAATTTATTFSSVPYSRTSSTTSNSSSSSSSSSLDTSLQAEFKPNVSHQSRTPSSNSTVQATFEYQPPKQRPLPSVPVATYNYNGSPLNSYQNPSNNQYSSPHNYPHQSGGVYNHQSYQEPPSSSPSSPYMVSYDSNNQQQQQQQQQGYNYQPSNFQNTGNYTVSGYQYVPTSNNSYQQPNNNYYQSTPQCYGYQVPSNNAYRPPVNTEQSEWIPPKQN